MLDHRYPQLPYSLQKEEEKKKKAFRKEKKDREEKAVKKGKVLWMRSVRGEGTARWWKGYRKVLADRCYSCLGVGHVAVDCVRRGPGRGFEGGRR